MEEDSIAAIDDERIKDIWERAHFRFIRVGGERYMLTKPEDFKDMMHEMIAYLKEPLRLKEP